MPDQSQGVDIVIRTSIEGSGAKNVGSDLEKLTNTGKGLATSLPNLTAVTSDFVITSENEYRAIVAAHEALEKKIPVMQAMGKDVTALVAAQENLGNALSTESALQMAATLEAKAAAAAALENAAAQETSAAATGINTVAMRELTVIARELERGNFSRLPGSISILASQFNLLQYIFSPVGIGMIGLGAASFFLYEHLKHVNEALDEVAATAAKSDFTSNIEDQIKVLDDAAGALQKYADEEANIGQSENTIATALKDQLSLMEAVARARAELVSAQKELDLSKIQQAEAEGKITPEQAITQKADLDKKYADIERQNQAQAAQDEIDTKQRALELAKKIQPTLDAQREQAEGILNQDQEHRAAVKEKTGDFEKNLAKAQKEKDQAEELVAAFAANAAGTSTGGQRWLTTKALFGGISEADAQKDAADKQGNLQRIQEKHSEFLQTQTPAAAAQLAKEKDEAVIAQELAKKNLTLQGTLPDEIQSAQDKLAAVAPIQGQTASAQDATGTVKEETALLKQGQSDVEEINRFATEKKPSSEAVIAAKKAIDDLHSFLKDRDDVLLKLATMLGETLPQFEQKLSDLSVRLGTTGN